jgi:hypothetical protein
MSLLFLLTLMSITVLSLAYLRRHISTYLKQKKLDPPASLKTDSFIEFLERLQTCVRSSQNHLLPIIINTRFEMTIKGPPALQKVNQVYSNLTPWDCLKAGVICLLQNPADVVLSSLLPSGNYPPAISH